MLRLHEQILVGFGVLDGNSEIINEGLQVVGKLGEVIDSLKSAGFVMKNSNNYISIYHLAAAGRVLQYPFRLFKEDEGLLVFLRVNPLDALAANLL